MSVLWSFGGESMMNFALIASATTATWPPMIISMVDGEERPAAILWRPAA
jgi:hypothetical protein